MATVSHTYIICTYKIQLKQRENYVNATLLWNCECATTSKCHWSISFSFCHLQPLLVSQTTSTTCGLNSFYLIDTNAQADPLILSLPSTVNSITFSSRSFKSYIWGSSLQMAVAASCFPFLCASHNLSSVLTFVCHTHMGRAQVAACAVITSYTSVVRGRGLWSGWILYLCVSQIWWIMSGLYFIFLTHFCWELELIDYGRKLKGAAITCLSL
jgi:hypothetical protein